MRSTTPAAASAAFARDVRATWWYTALSVIFFHISTLVLWALPVFGRETVLPAPAAVALFVGGGTLSLVAAVLLLARYRGEPLEEETPAGALRRVAWLLSASAAAAIMLGLAAWSPLLGAGMVAYALCLVHWRPGIRMRLGLTLLLALVVIWLVEARRVPDGLLDEFIPLPVFAVVLGPISAVSLWWWDIVRALDSARLAEGRLAAAQERLRLAHDLHDLQGHHLQVIALQLELAEKMMARDSDAALGHIRSAHASVDEARRGTRDLASRFRGVPLPDELANAADLLRAAGLRVVLDVADDADSAPADVLGPVVREATTNILKHGGGAAASLSLRREDGGWLLDVENDTRDPLPPRSAGSGLVGVAERVGAVGGRVQADAADGRFRVQVRVPAGATA